MAYGHPGVYIREVAGAQTITGVDTDIAAFVGVCSASSTAPVNTPYLVTSWQNFQARFGGFAWGRYLAYSVFQFFLQGGSNCYVVRASTKTAVSTLEIPSASSSGGSGNTALTLTFTSEGAWSNQITILVSDYPRSNKPASEGANPTDSFSLYVTYQSDAAISASTPIKATNPWPEQQIINYIQQNLDNIRRFSETVTNTGGGSATTNYYYILEAYEGLNAAVDYTSAINTQSIFVRAVATAQSSGDSSDGNSVVFPRPANGSYVSNSVSDYATYDFATARASLASIEVAGQLVIPDLAVLLNTSGAIDTSGIRSEVISGLQFCETYNSTKGLFYVIDSPPDVGTPTSDRISGILAFKNGDSEAPALNSPYGALYYPWIYVGDPTGNTRNKMLLPPSGNIAGVYARTDRQAGVFKAPAGTQDGRMLSAVGLTTIISDSEQDLLNPDGINALRNIFQIGNVVWGARTVSANTEWTYINVRRLITFIELSLRAASLKYVFESNSPALWARVDRDFTGFLTTVWRQGALFGTVASEAFYVIVDESNNPQESRDLGVLNVSVGVAPVKPAEFVVISIKQIQQSPS